MLYYLEQGLCLANINPQKCSLSDAVGSLWFFVSGLCTLSHSQIKKDSFERLQFSSLPLCAKHSCMSDQTYLTGLVGVKGESTGEFLIFSNTQMMNATVFSIFPVLL